MSASISLIKVGKWGSYAQTVIVEMFQVASRLLVRTGVMPSLTRLAIQALRARQVILSSVGVKTGSCP